MALTFILRPGANFSAGEFVTVGPAVAMRSAYDLMRAKGLVPTQFSVDRFGGLNVTLSDGIRVLLGPANDLEKKLGLVTAVLAQMSHQQRRIAAIDVRAPATPVVVYR
ncbi:MAG: cell division protein FtsQ [Candidatus Eremiobacteraeota bacterium]|nr:cell division protein FtsQ [Candidatus Eremiobacteraeota bacterium]